MLAIRMVSKGSYLSPGLNQELGNARA
jgi:hypothetical protein